LTFLLPPEEPHRPPERVIGTDWQSIITALGSARAPSVFSRFPARRTQKTLDQALPFPLAEIVIDGLPRREIAGQHSPLTACFEQVEQAVENVAAQVMLAMARRIEKPADFLPLGVRQVGAICFAHSFGVFFGGKAIHHRKRDGLPFVFASENQNQNSF
jgi:hypothetical protein